MSMMNANAAATTAMTANEPLDFELPEMGDSDFSNEELAEDMDGLTMSFPRIKIPAGGVLQFEIPNGDPQHPDYSPTLTGVILFSHASCVYWPEGDEYSDDVPPLCSSVDGKQGYGEPGGVCETCALSQFGSASNGRGKACKNMRVLYLLRSGEFMPLAINLSPTSISPFREFLNQGFAFRKRAIYGSLVEIGLKRQTNPEGKPAIFSTGGEMYHTAPVVKIHETEAQEIHFETSTTHYYIKPRPFVLAVLNPRRQTLAACA